MKEVSNGGFYSDGYGCYQVSSLCAGCNHSIEESRYIFGKITGEGKKYGDFAHEWKLLQPKQQAMFLLERHEVAHHALLHTTPIGILLWRVNQVICRDIHYLSGQIRKFDLSISFKFSPQEWFSSKEFISACSEKNVSKERFDYLKEVVKVINDLLKLTDIFYGHNAADKFSYMTLGELAKLLNRTFEYLALRCAVPFVGNWTTNSPHKKIFAEPTAFNCLDLIEVHAICEELYHLRAFRDVKGFQYRVEQALRGSHSKCMQFVTKKTKTGDAFGFSPYHVQLLVLLSCSCALDLGSLGKENELLVEEHLPWLRVAEAAETQNGEFSISTSLLEQSLMSLINLSHSPLVTTESNWLQYFRVPRNQLFGKEELDRNVASQFFSNIFSLGLDAQFALIKAGFAINIEFLENVITAKDINAEYSAFDKWKKKLLLSICLIEYSDGCWYRPNLLPKITQEFLAKAKLQYLDYWLYPLIGCIANGAIVREAIATYTGKATPKVIILKDKLSMTLRQDMKDCEPIILETSILILDTILGDNCNNLAPFNGDYSFYVSKHRYN